MEPGRRQHSLWAGRHALRAWPAPSILGIPGLENSALEINPGPQDISIEFGGYHAHFSYEEHERQGLREAFLLIDGLQREHLAVGRLSRGQRLICCWVLDARTLHPVDSYPLLYLVKPSRVNIAWPWLAAEQIDVASWRGTVKLRLDRASALKKLPLPNRNASFDSEG